MFDIKVIAKLGDVTYRVELEERSGGKKKARLERHNLTG